MRIHSLQLRAKSPDHVALEVHCSKGTYVRSLAADVAQALGSSDRPFLDDMEKRLQKRIIVKARGSFHVEDFEIRSPGEKPLEKSDAGRGDARMTRWATGSIASASSKPELRLPITKTVLLR